MAPFLSTPSTAQAPASQQQAPLEWNVASNLTGYFTWNNGKGGIAWSASAPTEDRSADVGTCTTDTTGTRCTPGTLEFLSDPLPRTLFLNVSHRIVVDWFGSWSSPGPLVITLGADLVAGQYQPTNYIPCSTSNPCPSSPFYWGANGKQVDAGYTPMLYRPSPEMMVLPAGSQLKVQISTAQHAGTAAHHRSNIQLIYLPEEEAFFRYPKAFGAVAYSSPSPAANPGAGLAPLVLLPFAGSKRRLGAALAFVMMSSGCTSTLTGDSPETQPNALGGQADFRTIPGDGGSDPVEGRVGTLLGYVRDEVGAPVADAHVSIPELYNFTSTSKFGKFEFKALPVGTHTLRVEKQGYKVYSGKVGIVPFNVTLANVRLEWAFENPSEAHRHDYWRETDTLKVFDGSVANTCGPYGGQNAGQTGPYTDAYAKACAPGAWFTVPETRAGTNAPNIIVPGTAEMEVQIDWPSTGTPRRVGFTAVSPDSNFPKFFLPREAKKPFHVKLNWDMTDPGHSLYTYWQFGFFYEFDDPYVNPGYTNSLPAHGGEDWSLGVKIVLHRDESFPIEDPHPDFWGANQTLGVAYWRGPVQFSYQFNGPDDGAIRIDAQNMTPPGTRLLEATLSWEEDPVPPFSFDTLHFKTAAHSPNCGAACRTPADDPSSPSPRTFVWRIPVTDATADPYYAPRTTWQYWLEPDDANNERVNGAKNLVFLNMVTGGKPYTFKVVAHRGTDA